MTLQERPALTPSSSNLGALETVINVHNSSVYDRYAEISISRPADRTMDLLNDEQCQELELTALVTELNQAKDMLSIVSGSAERRKTKTIAAAVAGTCALVGVGLGLTQPNLLNGLEYGLSLGTTAGLVAWMGKRSMNESARMATTNNRGIVQTYQTKVDNLSSQIIDRRSRALALAPKSLGSSPRGFVVSGLCDAYPLSGDIA
jgi:hypothetical protein